LLFCPEPATMLAGRRIIEPHEAELIVDGLNGILRDLQGEKKGFFFSARPRPPGWRAGGCTLQFGPRWRGAEL